MIVNVLIVCAALLMAIMAWRDNDKAWLVAWTALLTAHLMVVAIQASLGVTP